MGEPSVEPHLFAILGATGDLTKRKLLPALFHLRAHGELQKRNTLIVGAAQPVVELLRDVTEEAILPQPLEIGVEIVMDGPENDDPDRCRVRPRPEALSSPAPGRIVIEGDQQGADVGGKMQTGEMGGR